MSSSALRLGYSAEIQKNEKTGEEEVVLKARNPELQLFLENLLREGSKRRLELSVGVEGIEERLPKAG